MQLIHTHINNMHIMIYSKRIRVTYLRIYIGKYYSAPILSFIIPYKYKFLNKDIIW